MCRCFVSGKDDDQGRLTPVEEEDAAGREKGRKDALIFEFVNYRINVRKDGHG